MEKNQNRTGETRITSVSVSTEFQKILDRYDLSPTEVFRRGLGVTLHDLGVQEYMTPLNDERSKYVKEFFKIMKDNEDIKEFFDKLAEFSKELNKNA